MAQDAQLLLKVGLDLSTFRNQLATLGQAAAGYNLPIKIKFDRLAIQNELNALGVNIKRRNYRLNIETNLSAEIKKARDLADALANIPKGGGAQRTAGVVEAGFSQATLRKLGQDIKPLYKAAAQAGMVAFSEEIANNVQKIAKELSEVGKDSIAGLLNGLKSGDAQLKTAARSLGQSLISSIKGILGIASPSKVFKDIGSDVGKGFELGAVASMDKAFDVLERQIQERLKRLQAMIQPQTSRRGAFPFVAKSGPIESGALFAESTSLARQIDQARAQIAQIQGRRQERLSLQQSSLAQAAGRLLPPARDRSLPAARETIIPGSGAVEQVSLGFVQSLRNTRDVLARNFSANTYFPKATRNLASSMNVAARQLTGTKIAGLLPSKEMMEPLRFQRAAIQAARIDAERAAKARRPIGGAFPMEGMMGPSRPVDRSFSNYITAEFTRMMRAGALGGGYAFPNAPMMGPSSQLPPRGSMTVESFGNIRALGGRFPSARMLQVGGPPAMAQHMGGMMSGYQTRAGAMGGYNPGVRSSAFFPMEGMLAPSSPLGRITAQSSMFGGGPPSVPPGGGGGSRRPSGGGDFFGGLGRLSLPGAGTIRELGSEFAFATKQVLLFGQAYKLLAFVQDFPGQVGQAVGQLQSFRNTLNAISPSAAEAAKSNEFILSIVDKYNIPIQSARDGFTKLYASMEPAGFRGEEIRGLFESISMGAATFGMSADKVDRVIYAFSQMASKGQVMSEELKGQLGDVLPGSMALFAEAAGFKGPDAISKFSAALEDGVYKGQNMVKLLKNVRVVMEQEFGPGAEGAARTFQGGINRMQNSLRQLYEAFEPVAVNFMNQVVKPLTDGLRVAADGFTAFLQGVAAKTPQGAAFAQELERLRPALEGIGNNLKGLLPTFELFGNILLNVGKILMAIAGNPITGFLLKVYANVLLVNTVFSLLGGKVLIDLISNIGAAIARFIALNVQMGLLQRTTAVANSSLAGTQLQMALLTRNAGAALGPIGLLKTALMGLARIGLIAIAIQVVIDGIAEIDRLKKSLDDIAGFSSKEYKKQVQGLSREEVNSRIIVNRRSQAQARKDLQEFTGPVGVAKGLITGRDEELRARLVKYQIQEAVLQGARGNKTQAQLMQSQAGGVLEAITGGGEGGKKGGKKGAADKAAKAAERAAKEAQTIEAVLKQLREEIRIRSRILQIDQNIAMARADQDEEAVASYESDKRLLELGTRKAKIQKDFDAGRIKQAEYNLRMQLLEIDRSEEQMQHENDINRILRERYGILDAVVRAAREARQRAFEAGGGGADTFRTDINLMPELTGGELGAGYTAAKEQLAELAKASNQIIGAAQAIGDAFATSFKGVISGSMSAQQALAGFFQSVASYFLDMAAKMIAKWIEMQIIGLAMSLLPGGSSIFPKGPGNFSGAFGAGGPKFSPAAFGAANGAVWQGGFQAFANGGMVTGPTLGLIGEGRYNEAIVPLPDGRSIPVEMMGGGSGDISITINVDAKGTKTEGDEGQAKALASIVSAAVQSEIVKQQRPGGLLVR